LVCVGFFGNPARAGLICGCRAHRDNLAATTWPRQRRKAAPARTPRKHAAEKIAFFAVSGDNATGVIAATAPQTLAGTSNWNPGG
tara:strand:- start:3623 stop:3877 length:255 start_codon:yes stop_codon:yes gene_type:complete